MEDNIFFKNKKDKFNPDVISNLSKKNTEMRKDIFVDSKFIYNGITNVVPESVRNVKDLRLEKDQPLDNVKKLLKLKRDERMRQESELKPQKLKTLPDLYIVDKHIENFDELKKNSETHIKQTINEHNTQKTKYNDIMSSLKDLGIIKD